MGLAATQARYLGLTARKTNIEFEGQQVNQQRTVLANESAGIYKQLYSLKVPVPPNVTDFYKTEYGYNVGSNTYLINSWKKSTTARDKYNVNVTYDKTVNIGAKAFANGTITDSGTANQYYVAIGSNTYIVDTSKTTTNDLIDKARGLKTKGTYYSYTDTKSDTPYYMDKTWFDNNVPITTTSAIQRYYITTETAEVTENHDGCTLKFNSSGGISNIIDPEVTDTELTVNSATIKDDDAYNAAMNKYNSEKMSYEKQITEINAKTEKIQSEDRSLELRLRQLDTEQEALQTELGSLKSVLDKNIEKVFKVFA